MYNYKDSNVYIPSSVGSADVRCPQCGSDKKIDEGTCAEGCCDRYKCGECGYRFVIEWPD